MTYVTVSMEKGMGSTTLSVEYEISWGKHLVRTLRKMSL